MGRSRFCVRSIGVSWTEGLGLSKGHLLLLGIGPRRSLYLLCNVPLTLKVPFQVHFRRIFDRFQNFIFPLVSNLYYRSKSKITKKTKALLIPNLIGNIPNWVEIKKIANRNNLKIIEDSADTLGAKINNK